MEYTISKVGFFYRELTTMITFSYANFIMGITPQKKSQSQKLYTP